MSTIKLVAPLAVHQAAAEDFKQEFLSHGELVINGSALLDQMEYPAWLANTQRNNDPATVREDWVVSSTFFAFRECDRRLVGIIDLRHNLDNAFLAAYGGHIGYAVRPTERHKGYATEMLRLTLAYAEQLGLAQVMLGCYADNLASKRTIAACGGRLAQTKLYTDRKPMEIYSISLIRK